MKEHLCSHMRYFSLNVTMHPRHKRLLVFLWPCAIIWALLTNVSILRAQINKGDIRWQFFEKDTREVKKGNVFGGLIERLLV